jgi:hypothetical protein
MAVPRLHRSVRGAPALTLVFAGLSLLGSACNNSASTTTPTTPANSTNYHGSMTSANYAATVLDMALTATGGGATQSVSGSYSTANGITGQVQGTITGSLGGGSFAGTLTYNTSPLGGTNCNGSGSFTGNINSTTGIDWTSAGFRSSCPGDPTGIRAAAAPGGSGPTTPTPTPTPPPTSINLTGTWLLNGQPVFTLTQSGNTVTGADAPLMIPPTSGITITSSSVISGTVSGSTFAGTDQQTVTVSVQGLTASTCTATSSLLAQVTSTTMTGTYTSLVTLSCTPSLPPGVTVPQPVPQSFTATKQ